MGMEIEGDGRARISSTRSGSRSCLASCTSWQSRQPEKLHLSLQQYQLLNMAHKTRCASKSSHNIHKTSLKDNSKNTRSDRNVVKGARAARIQQNKCELLDPVVAEATLDFRNLNKRKLLTNFLTFLPQAWLLILYTGLALRENILRVNGSDIRPWWIKHHYFAMAMALISLTWEIEREPDYSQKQRGVQLFLQWAIM
ncbi:uncharacterized protein LOC114290151 isoform X2 [Camellia sinensis]|uniref:uncharacterized protein LOC114290151 isoform X2 n=1 Tax=Camellia sinensis TaxID=4442 RepID=UPI001036A72A|nr:uncharacterized protein LOC114290151 isoform X2 [Camellia sinensis]